MSASNDVIQYLTGADAPAKLRWINADRKSDDWKVKIFQHDASELQLAIYDRVGIFVLLEHVVDGVLGTKHLPKRPKSDALRVVGESKFISLAGSYYEVNDLSSLGSLVRKYLGLDIATVPEISTLDWEFDQELSKSLADSAEARRRRLETASKKARTVTATITVFARNADVVAEVLVRANGVCEGCGNAAPFRRRSTEHHSWRYITGRRWPMVATIRSRTPLRYVQTVIGKGIMARSVRSQARRVTAATQGHKHHAGEGYEVYSRSKSAREQLLRHIKVQAQG